MSGTSSANCPHPRNNLLVNGIKKTAHSMNSRDKILSTVNANQPPPGDLPPDHAGPVVDGDLTPRFISMLESIGGATFLVSGYDRIATILHEQFPDAKRIVTTC